MPNVKFSGFNAITSVGANGFLVGYDSVTNLNTRIGISDLQTEILSSVTNPTAGFIPYNNSGVFSDSYIVMDTVNEELYTEYGGDKKGIQINYAFNFIKLGDWDNVIDGTSLNIGYAQATIASSYNDQSNGLYLNLTPNSEKFRFGHLLEIPSQPIPNDRTYIEIRRNKLEVHHSDNLLNPAIAGLNLDFTSRSYQLGEISATNNGTTLVVDDTNSFIKSQYGGNDSGIILDFANEQYGIGDIGGLGGSTQFFIDDANGIIKGRSAGIDNGLLLDFNNGFYYIGNYGGPGTHIKIDDTGTIKSFFGSTAKGFNLDNITNIYDFGDVSGGAWLSIDGTNTSVTTNAQILVFDDGGSGALLSNTSSGNSGQHLVVTIDGNTYHIKLEIP